MGPEKIWKLEFLGKANIAAYRVELIELDSHGPRMDLELDPDGLKFQPVSIFFGGLFADNFLFNCRIFHNLLVLAGGGYQQVVEVCYQGQ